MDADLSTWVTLHPYTVRALPDSPAELAQIEREEEHAARYAAAERLSWPADRIRVKRVATETRPPKDAAELSRFIGGPADSLNVADWRLRHTTWAYGPAPESPDLTAEES